MTDTAKTKMHKIAIVKFAGGYTSYDDYEDNIIRSITEWEFVDDETFQLLQKASLHLYGTIADNGDTRFQVIECVHTKSEEVVKTVSAYVAMVEERKSATEKEARRLADKAAEKKRMAGLTTAEKKRKLYLELREEFGEDAK